MDARLCIDFGTALSKASVCFNPDLALQGVRPLPIGAVSAAAHPLLTPSVLFVDGGRLFFGPLAFARARSAMDEGREPLLSFKTVLGAENLDAALAQRIGPDLDPTGTFRQRDALVLYLAYLDQLIRAALVSVAPDLEVDRAALRTRYTSPVWRDGGGMDATFGPIFDEATAVSRKLGALLLSPEGISIAQCKDSLDKAFAPGEGRLETGVFEPHAAAAASLAFTTEPTRMILVMDMGAGTTDFAAFEFDEDRDPPLLEEIRSARQCSALAGDVIDRILVNLIASRLEGGGRDARLLLAAAKLEARAAKEALFATGACTLRRDGRSVTVRLEDLYEDQQFRQFIAALLQTIARSLAPVLQLGHEQRIRQVDIVLAGGGARLPFLPQLFEEASKGRLGSTSIRINTLGPPCPYYTDLSAELGAVFPQVAMSIGGALVEVVR